MKVRGSPFLMATTMLLCGSAAGACDLQVAGGWLREPPPGARSAAGYGILSNTGKSVLRIVSVSLPGGGTAMMHESRMQDGVMQMPHLESLSLAPGEKVRFAPMGKHIMLMNLPAMPKAGGHLRIEFGDALGCKTQADFVVVPLTQDGPPA